MNDKKMTAVEWLYFELWKETDFSIPSYILDMAKKMEKQQIIDACNYGDFEELGEQYYKETYER